MVVGEEHREEDLEAIMEDREGAHVPHLSSNNKSNRAKVVDSGRV